MKEYFTDLFNYDKHCNQLLLQSITQAGNPEKAVQLMDHLLSAQQIWLNRCKNIEQPKTATVWPDWPAEDLAAIIEANHRKWINFIDSIADFNERIYYKTFQAAPFDNLLHEIIIHILNHGTHHRAQIGQYLKQAGLEKLPSTDYIAFKRN